MLPRRALPGVVLGWCVGPFAEPLDEEILLLRLLVEEDISVCLALVLLLPVY